MTSSESVFPGLHSWLDEWTHDLRAGRPGEETITVYRRSIRQFLDWLVVSCPDAPDRPSGVTRTHCRDWMISLVTAGKSEATRKIRGIALRKFFKYICGEPDSGLTINPADGLQLPEPKVQPVPLVSDADLTTLLKSMGGSSFVDRRDTALVRLLLDAGIRRAELIMIDLEDLDMRFSQVLVHGKGTKDRIVPFGSRTNLALRKYLRARESRTGVASSKALFCATRSTSGDFRLTGNGIGAILTRRCAAAGLDHFHPHQLRHSWAAANKAAGMSDDQLERLAGWTTPMMSRRYGAVVADQQARDAARRLNLGDRV